ncbi:MAG: hypothetical protein LUD12_13245 [Lachnospiraceae bacterium]|nr:hypothetical protein [Lachnospiraceae bacterium]
MAYKNKVHEVRVGDQLKRYVTQKCSDGMHETKAVEIWNVTDVYDYHVVAERKNIRMSFNYGELVVMGYEKQSLQNQAMIAIRSRDAA